MVHSIIIHWLPCHHQSFETDMQAVSVSYKTPFGACQINSNISSDVKTVQVTVFLFHWGTECYDTSACKTFSQGKANNWITFLHSLLHTKGKIIHGWAYEHDDVMQQKIHVA